MAPKICACANGSDPDRAVTDGTSFVAFVTGGIVLCGYTFPVASLPLAAHKDGPGG